ncbi:hypothetical protein LPN04_20185 [Rugamonas sp. A1-17]|nr:hypothetical protein [Rugamonas sp. A1-17]
MSRRIIELHTLERAPDWRRRGWLALIAGAHVLAFIGWRTPERPLAASVGRHEAITYILAPAKPSAQPKPMRVAAAPRVTPLRAAPPQAMPQPITQPMPPPISQPEQPAAPQAITQTTPPPDPFAQPPAKPAEDLRQRSIKSAAAVDRQLRKEAWNPRDKKIANDATPLAMAIARAYVGNDRGTTTEELSTPDGRAMTRVRTPGGSTYCATMQSNHSAANDPFRNGVKTNIGTCPKSFGK